MGVGKRISVRGSPNSEVVGDATRCRAVVEKLDTREGQEMRHFARGVEKLIVRAERRKSTRENSRFQAVSDPNRYPTVSDRLRAREHRETRCFVRGVEE